MEVRTTPKLYGARKVRLEGRIAYPLHTHDFGEVFWVDKGACLHRVNDVDVVLNEGDCVFIRPSDRHSLHSLPRRGPFWIVNVLFQWHVYEGIKLRYFSDQTMLYGEDQLLPRTVPLTERQLAWLREALLDLVKPFKHAFYIDQMLMRLLSECGQIPEETTLIPSAAPPWLQEAWMRFRNPLYFREGVPAFCRLCGRSPEHVSREFRRHTGQTLTHQTNVLRLEYAATLLSGTRQEITEVAMACGLENLSHFYSQFRAHYKMTPRAYRLSKQGELYPKS